MLNAILKRLHEPIYRRRIAVLSELIAAQLKNGDAVLDIGCGNGVLGAAILASSSCPAEVTVQGLEKAKRGGEPIEVIAHPGGPLPFADRSVDVVILADVLHHELQEDELLAEAARICRRILIIKDHKPEGLLSYPRICFMDWAANQPHHVKCLFRYHTRAEWQQIFAAHHLRPVTEKASLNLYPLGLNFVFGRRLQYFAVVEHDA
jgi:ubiquinone/menaquinone biosynthesis C-methylase UbiE